MQIRIKTLWPSRRVEGQVLPPAATLIKKCCPWPFRRNGPPRRFAVLEIVLSCFERAAHSLITRVP